MIRESKGFRFNDGFGFDKKATKTQPKLQAKNPSNKRGKTMRRWRRECKSEEGGKDMTQNDLMKLNVGQVRCHPGGNRRMHAAGASLVLT